MYYPVNHMSLYMQNNITYIVLEEYINCSKNIINGNYYNKFSIKESKFICSERHISWLYVDEFWIIYTFMNCDSNQI